MSAVPVTLLARIGWRNIWRYRRRNLMLFAAIFLAVGAVVLTNAMIRGYQYDTKEDAVANLTGDLKVLAPGYRADPSIDKRFPLPPDWHTVLPDDAIMGRTARLRVPAVIMSERDTRGVQLVGIHPQDERTLSFLGETTIEGERLTGTGDRRLLIGKALADQLETEVGRRVVIATQGSDLSNRELGYRIAGTFDARGTGLEQAFVFTGIDAMQRVLDAPGVTEVSVRLTDDARRAEVRRILEGAFPGQEVFGWRELEPQAAAMFEFTDAAIFIWFAIMMLGLTFGLVNTLVTAVMERTRELGMLRAVGMRPLSVIVQVVIESSLMMAVGVVVGVLAGIGAVALLADGLDLSRWAAGIELAGMHAVLEPRLLAQDVLLVVVLSLVLGVLASVYPAWRAVKIKPLDALRR